VDREAGEVTATPLFAWREAAFVARYADAAPAQFATRSPVERAILGLLGPHLVGAEQLAFWMNAYNACVLRAVIDHYPIRGTASAYPASSLRQISGVFDRQVVRVGGHAVTLDALEQERLAPLGDARALLALGRGAVGSGRLRSEAYAADRLDAQLAQAEAEVATRHALARVDREAGEVTATPLFAWREAAFVARYADEAPAQFATRSPVERAILGLLGPHLVGAERDFLEANTFRVRFHDFDWSLNDLTGR
jgi:hypothetical protein